MKHILVLLLLFTSLARADEIGSQYKEQAEAGDARAQYYLADTYFSSGDSKQASLWAEKAAKGVMSMQWHYCRKSVHAGRLPACQSAGATGNDCGQQTWCDYVGTRAGKHSGGQN
jgi:hypothetical protein